MADPTIYMQFLSKAVPDGTLQVIRMDGTEELSRPYRFTIELVSAKPDLDLDRILEQPATLTLRRGDATGGRRTAQTLKVHGALETFEQLDPGPNWFNYRAVLVPRLQLLTLSCQSRIFQEQAIPAIVTEVLKGAGFTTADFEFKTSGTHPAKEYVVQYQESDFDFVSRLLEHEGIYYFFAQDGEHEKIVFTDSATTPRPVATEPNVPFRLGAGLADRASADAEFHEETVCSLLARRSAVPQKVVLKDYNYRKPSVELKAEAQVNPKGKGTVYEFGDHFKDAAQGNDLAKLRAEALRCREKWFLGRGDHRAFRAGYTFRLKEHARGDFNGNYLLTRVSHAGRQRIALGPVSAGEGWEYVNEFAAIPADVVFRPERVTPWPRVHGTINAMVDAGASGEYAEIDDHGRYKVKLPFDLSDRKDGKASRYIRMAQPYAGAGMGMHFPLHKGTEVMLTHIDGDPDRPVIAAAVPNAETAGPVSGSNQTQCAIHTGGGNRMVIEDTKGSEQIMLYSPHADTKMTMGGPGSGFHWTTTADLDAQIDRNVKWYVKGEHDEVVHGKYNVVSETGPMIRTVKSGDLVMNVDAGNEFRTINGNQDIKVKGNDHIFTTGRKKDYHLGLKIEVLVGAKTTFISPSKSETVVGDSTSIIGGVKREVMRGVGIKSHLGTSYEVAPAKQSKIPTIKQTYSEVATQAARKVQRVTGDWKMKSGAKAMIKAAKVIQEATKIEETAEDFKLVAKAMSTIKSAKVRLKAADLKVEEGYQLKLKGGKLTAGDNTLTVS